MDKTFIENCKVLKRHFTKLTQTDTTTQSNCSNSEENDSLQAIIKDAKNLLLREQIEMLSDEDIARLKEKSLNRYVRELRKYENHENKQSFHPCQNELCKWDDEIFTSPLPHPQNNAEYLKLQKINIDSNCEIMTDANALNKFNNLAINKITNDARKEIIMGDKNNETVTSFQMEENVNKITTDMVEEKIITDKNNTKVSWFEMEKNITIVEKLEKNVHCSSGYNDNSEVPGIKNQEVIRNINQDIVDIPELIVIPQKNNEPEFLEVRKINLEDKDNIVCDVIEDQEPSRIKEITTKTIRKWKKFTKEKKNVRKTKHQEKIYNFLENLQKVQLANADKTKGDLTNNFQKSESKLKPKICPRIDSKILSFEHRFRAQKDIIEIQKQKLEEQNKLIEELKLNKIQKEAKESLEQASDLRKKMLNSSKYKFKTKEKIETHETEKSENSLDIYLSFNKAPRVLQMMENRARERQERRLLIQERKRLIDEEKKRQAEELVEMQKKEEANEKKKRIEILKKQRQTVRQLEFKKQLEKKHFILMTELATNHYKKQLKSYGIKYFKMLIYNLKIKTEIAKRFYESNIVIHCFKAWSKFTYETNTNKNNLVTFFYKQTLLRKVISCWKVYVHQINQSNQVAIDIYEMSLQSKYFIAWHRLVCEHRMQYILNAQKADNYYKRFLMFQCFENWRCLPAIKQIERVQNERKRKWRLRVAEVLTDYDPLKNYDY